MTTTTTTETRAGWLVERRADGARGVLVTQFARGGGRDGLAALSLVVGTTRDGHAVSAPLWVGHWLTADVVDVARLSARDLSALAAGLDALSGELLGDDDFPAARTLRGIAALRSVEG